MTVLANVMTGAFLRDRRPEAAREKAREAIDFVGLSARENAAARDLTSIDQRRLEMARALATQPRLLLLDEVMAGLNPAEIDQAVALVGKLSSRGLTIVIVEHLMRAIMAVAKHIVVLDHGQKIAEGTPERRRRKSGSDPRLSRIRLRSRSGRRNVVIELSGVSASYGNVPAINGVTINVGEGEAVGLLGANGAGKSTTLRAISGLVKLTSGAITFLGVDLASLPPHKITELGIAHVPEGRQVFPEMTVNENLEIGSYAPRAKADRASSLDLVYSIFPRLAERRKQLAGTMSGGEQQMLAVGRGLMLKPRLLMLDEPSLGLAPVMCDVTFEKVAEIHKMGTAILLVEQNVSRALTLVQRAYVLESGKVILDGTTAQLAGNKQVQAAYLGI